MTDKFRKPALAVAFAVLTLSACSSQPPAARDAEMAQLRARVERLEQESATERARLAADITAMRQDLGELRASLDEASRTLADTREQDKAADPAAAKNGKSPRQALRDSLRGMVEGSRAALDRLSRELDKQLEKHSDKPKNSPPAEPPAPDQRAI
ncbi:MAG: hypothetical protein RDU24_12255 [Humidesulfovibrio sp.]|uniref:hypothetical protein n=1 Tax=Humidesulfovibrio sp. TaxID=2910988 RepID=UPI0027F80C8C|nr:hypothetical protein [Humidesulfovibrio sp.]MDQ7836148.1 hypothetical protein [Humidesulfovibrio sp.]